MCVFEIACAVQPRPLKIDNVNRIGSEGFTGGGTVQIAIAGILLVARIGTTHLVNFRGCTYRMGCVRRGAFECAHV